MKLSIYTRYDRLGASSRYRYFMYLDILRRAGWQPVIKPFFSNRYLKKLYRDGKKSRLSFAFAMLKRLLQLPFAGRNLLIEYELLPFVPYDIEKLLLRRRRYILNFDDDVWDKYHKTPNLKDKFDQLTRHAAGVIVANDLLWERCLALNPKVIKIPTAVDLELYHCDKPKFDIFTVVWIGTPVTYRFLEQNAAILQEMAKAVDFELLVIAVDSLAKRTIPGVKMRFVNWSPEEEIELLMRSHVGIMPLVNDNFSKGKSAFKLIQYLAAGLPVIASPIGENCTVVNDGVNGFLAHKSRHWVKALKLLSTDRELYDKFAAAAKSSSQHFSIQKYGKFMLDFLDELFKN